MSYRTEFKKARRRMMNACSCAIASRSQVNPVTVRGGVVGGSPVQAGAQVGAQGGATVGPILAGAQPSAWSTWGWPSSYGAGSCSYDPETGTVTCYGGSYPATVLQYGGTPDAPMAYVSAQILGGARWVPIAAS